MGCNLFGGLVTTPKHFKFGVDVINVVERDGFRGFREDRGAEFQLSVMGGDEVEKMKAHVLTGRVKEGPVGGLGELHEVTPEFVDEFEPEGDVAEHFSVKIVGLGETSLGVAVLPHFAAVMEEDASDEEVAIEVGIDGAEGV
jgi:hypothetical protein